MPKTETKAVPLEVEHLSQPVAWMTLNDISGCPLVTTFKTVADIWKRNNWVVVPLHVIPEGWQIVPKTPTRQMLEQFGEDAQGVCYNIYKSMVAAVLTPVTPVIRPDPCPVGCASNLYHTGYKVFCQTCTFSGPETDEGAAKAIELWNEKVSKTKITHHLGDDWDGSHL